MSVKLLTEHHLEFLSLKGGCAGSSESTHVKMPHCWKSHVAAHLFFLLVSYYESAHGILPPFLLFTLSNEQTRQILHSVHCSHTQSMDVDEDWPKFRPLTHWIHQHGLLCICKEYSAAPV